MREHQQHKPHGGHYGNQDGGYGNMAGVGVGVYNSLSESF